MMLFLLGFAVGWIAGGAVVARYLPRHEWCPPQWITVADAMFAPAPGSMVKIGDDEYAVVLAHSTGGRLLVSQRRKKGPWER